MSNFFTLMRAPENRTLRNTFLGAVAALLVIGGLSLALIQAHDATHKAQMSATQATAAAIQAKAALVEADRAIDCLNNVLGARAAVQAKDVKAQTNFINAARDDAKSFAVLLVDLLESAPSSKSTPDFLAYIKVHATYVEVSEASAKTLADDQAYKDKHPLGKC